MGLINNLLILGIVLGVLIIITMIYKKLSKKENLFIVNCYVKSNRSRTNMTVPIIAKNSTIINPELVKTKLEKSYIGIKVYAVEIRSIIRYKIK